MPAPCDNSRHCLLSRHYECSAAIWGVAAGVQGSRPLVGVWGCPPAHKGRPEGIVPSGRRSGGCPSRALLICPLPERKGAGGWCEEAATPRRHCEEPATWQSGVGSRPLVGVWGCPPAHKGRPEGIAPSGRRSGGCPSRALLICPLPERKGAGGWFLTTYGISSSLPMLSRPWSARCASAACDSGYSVMRTSSTPLWAQSSTSLALSNHCSRVPVKWPIPVRVT